MILALRQFLNQKAVGKCSGYSWADGCEMKMVGGIHKILVDSFLKKIC